MATNFDDIVRDLAPQEDVPATQADRISRAIQQSVPPVVDIVRAVAQSTSGTKSFGEVLNAIKAGRIRQQQGLLNALNVRSRIKTRERGLDLDQRRANLAGERLELERVRTMATIDDRAATRALQKKRVGLETQRVGLEEKRVGLTQKNVTSQIAARERDLNIKEGKLILEDLKRQGADGTRVNATLQNFLPNPVERAIVMNEIFKDPAVGMTPQNHIQVIADKVAQLRGEGKIGGKKAEKSLERIEAESRAKTRGSEEVKARYREPKPRDRKITEMVKERGFSVQEAQDLVDGRVRAMAPDAYGNVWIVNVATKSVELAGGGEPRGGAAPPKVTGDVGLGPDEITTLEGAIRGGVGPWKSFYAFLDATVGGIAGAGSLFPETAQNRQFLREFAQIAKTVLVNNPRFPVAEQKIVARMLPDPDRFWQNPDTAALEARSLRKFIAELRDSKGEQLSDPRLTLNTKARLGDQVVAIEQILALMNAPLGTGAREAGKQRLKLKYGLE